MRESRTGEVYVFPLDFSLGYVYAQILDFSETYAFDGLRVQVFNRIEAGRQDYIKTSVSEVKESGVMIGPSPINKISTNRARTPWYFCWREPNFTPDNPPFKDLRGVLSSADWSVLKPWFKETGDAFEECSYEEVRDLECRILNHPDGIKVKATMITLIRDSKKVSEYYDLSNFGIRNLYVYVINTHFPKSMFQELVAEVE